MRLWPRVKSNAGSPDVERCKHGKSRATTVYFRLGKLRRVYTYVQHMWGIIGHVTVEAGSTVGTDGAPPHRILFSFLFEEGVYLNSFYKITIFAPNFSFLRSLSISCKLISLFMSYNL